MYCGTRRKRITELAAKLQGKRGMLVSNDIQLFPEGKSITQNLELAETEKYFCLSEEPGKLAAVWPGF